MGESAVLEDVSKSYYLMSGIRTWLLSKEYCPEEYCPEVDDSLADAVLCFVRILRRHNSQPSRPVWQPETFV